VVETILEAVDDFFIGDVDYGCVLLEEATHVLVERLALFLLDLCQVHASTRAPHGTREVASELGLQLIPLVYRVLVERLEPRKWSLVQVEGEVETLCVIVATRVLNGQGITPKPLYWVLLRVVLVDPELQIVG
jgi:hypothetical protein